MFRFLNENNIFDPKNNLNSQLMRKSFVIFYFLTVSHVIFSQAPLVKVRAGEDPLPFFPVSERYRYKEFYPGFFFDADGKPLSAQKLNFQLISGDLVSIEENGDTVTVNNKDHIYPNVQIRADFFVHTKDKDEYYHVLSKSETVKLVSKLRWMIIRREEVDNAGYAGETQGLVRSTPSQRRDPTTNKMIKNENLVYSKIMSFYIMNSDTNIKFATQASFIDSFPDYKKEIKTFVKENSTDFLNLTDLKKLFGYCVALKRGAINK